MASAFGITTKAHVVKINNLTGEKNIVETVSGLRNAMDLKEELNARGEKDVRYALHVERVDDKTGEVLSEFWSPEAGYKKYKVVMAQTDAEIHKIVKVEDVDGIEYKSEKEAKEACKNYWLQFYKNHDDAWNYDENSGYGCFFEWHEAHWVSLRSGEFVYFSVEEVK